MLKELTNEQESLLDKVAAEYIDQLKCNGCDLNAPDNADTIKQWLSVVYTSIYNTAVPKIIVCDSPDAALKLASELTGESQKYLDYMGISDSGWISRYDYFHRIGMLTDDEFAETYALCKFQKLIWDTVLCDELAILIRYPESVTLDSDGNLHNQSGPSVKWRDGLCEWFWHGLSVDERLVMRPNEFSAEEYKAIRSTEYRRALSEAMGWNRVVELLGARVLDTWVDPLTGLEYALLGAGNDRWLRKQSPIITSGSQPTYIEPVHEDLMTASAARKWQADDSLSVDSCEKDPILIYDIET